MELNMTVYRACSKYAMQQPELKCLDPNSRKCGISLGSFLWYDTDEIMTAQLYV
jgi:hypothetical protein